MAQRKSPPAHWLISCDESGVHGAKYYGFGALWMPWQRRGNFAGAIRGLREDHEYEYEIKWQKAKSRQYSGLFLDLVEYFFKQSWLAFTAVVVRKAIVDRSLHRGSLDIARQKHFTVLLTNKIRNCIAAQPHREHTFRIWVDPIASSNDKADEVVEIVSNRALAKAVGVRPVDKVIEHDSKKTPSIHLCDLLLGAVMDAWQQKAHSRYKAAIQQSIADHLGWDDLRADTYPEERKFNIWYLQPGESRPREVKTRPVNLTYPLPRRS